MRTNLGNFHDRCNGYACITGSRKTTEGYLAIAQIFGFSPVQPRVWDIIWGMSETLSGACLGHYVGLVWGMSMSVAVCGKDIRDATCISDAIILTEFCSEVRLVGGSGRHEGNILVGGITGMPVCDDGHSAQNAKVVCRFSKNTRKCFTFAFLLLQNCKRNFTRMLGYPFGQATMKSHFGRVSSTFKMDDVRCTGNEASLLDCRHNTVDDCGPDEGAGVICSNSNFRGRTFYN